MSAGQDLWRQHAEDEKVTAKSHLPQKTDFFVLKGRGSHFSKELMERY